MKLRLLLVARCLALLAWAVAMPAAAVFNFVPPGFTADAVVSGLPFATAVAFAPDGRIFIALKSGRVRVLANGVLLPADFIDLRASVCDCHDRGLLGIAVDPQFPAQPYVYLLFTYDPPGVAPDSTTGARVARLVRVDADPAQSHNVALAGMALPQTTPGGPGHWVMLGSNSTLANIGDVLDGRFTGAASCMTGLSMAGAPIEDCLAADENSHTIGSLAFAADGSLFVSNGDGANYGGADPRALRSQNLDSLSGKILHIDPATGFGVPDNPFFDPANPGRNRSKVWAFGLRNPFRIALDEVTNDVHIGDVGWSTWEEINRGKGANFGWPCYEGGAAAGNESGLTTSRVQPSYQAGSATSAACQVLYAQGAGAVVPPEFSYNRGTDGYGVSNGASANAGAIYRGGTYPGPFVGTLFIADYSRRWIRTLSFDAVGIATVSNFARETTNGVVQLLRGPDSNIWALVYHTSSSVLVRFRYTAGGNTPPTAVASATPSAGAAPLSVAFSAQGSFDPDAQALSYSWDFGGGATGSGLNVSHVFTTGGTHAVTLTVAELTAPFATATETLIVTAGSVPPLAMISEPAVGTTFGVGEGIAYAGSAEAGGVPLPPTALSWNLHEHHNEHIHSDALGTGASGALTFRDHADGVWVELCLTASEQALIDTQCLSLLPRQTQVALDSDPLGASILYEEEGVLLPTPALLAPTQGATRTLLAPAIHQWRSFDGWSDGLTDPRRSFVAGPTALSFSALYVNQAPAAAFSATPGGGSSRSTFSFDGSPSVDPEGGALTYAWAFGDGATGAGSAPVHTYAMPGAYTVTLEVADPAGGVASASSTAAVSNAAPVAAFSASLTTGEAPLAIDFDAGASSDPDGDALAYAWDFGDGATAIGAFVSHTYASPGVYTATLGVADPFAATGTHQVAITATVRNLPPTASAWATPLPALIGQSVSFNAATSADPDGSITSHAWDFGDGASAGGPIAAHAFSGVGSYAATLTVTDDQGAQATTAFSVTVVVAECADGIDNDGNGKTDFGLDPGCTTAADLVERANARACGDGIDNDADGRIDWPADAACTAPMLFTENPACQDGLDNDGQSGIDFDGGAAANGGLPLAAADPDCSGAAVSTESSVSGSSSCGIGPELALALPGLAWLRRRRISA